jgi:hypothetical protein
MTVFTLNRGFEIESRVGSITASRPLMLIPSTPPPALVAAALMWDSMSTRMLCSIR